MRCRLGLPPGRRGLANIAASNEQQTKFWRADSIGAGFLLKGGPVQESDFAPSGALRLWEYGVGDTVRHSTYASLRRMEDSAYELNADADLTLALKGGKMEISADGTTYQPLKTTANDGWIEARIAAAALGEAGVAYLKVAP